MAFASTTHRYAGSQRVAFRGHPHPAIGNNKVMVGFTSSNPSNVRHFKSVASSVLLLPNTSRITSSRIFASQQRRCCMVRRFHGNNDNSNNYRYTAFNPNSYSTTCRYGLFYPSSASTMIGHGIFVIPSFMLVPKKHFSIVSIPSCCEDDDSNNTPQILAHSPVVDVQVSIPSSRTRKRRIWQRLYDWLLRFWQHCKDVWFITIRTTEVVIRFSPLLILAPASILYEQYLSFLQHPSGTGRHNISISKFGDDDYYTKSSISLNWVSDYTWIYIRSAITALGPAFAKLGQWIATRRDIFPPHICDRLSILHDRGTTHDYHYTHTALVQAFGNDYYERGLQLNESSKIIGSGSAAQVYSVTLVQKGINDEIIHYPVAVKVLHPRMTERVERDLYFVQTIAKWLHALPIERIQLLNLPRAVENFGNILLRQTDLQIEANNLLQFRYNFYHNNEQNEIESAIFFPKPREGWISRNVLVEDLVSDAIPISEYLKDSTVHGIEIRKELASPLLRAFLKMIFIDNFVHCDLHAGNVLIQTYSTPTNTNTTTADKFTITNITNSISLWLSSTFGSNSTNIPKSITANTTTDNTKQRFKIVFLDAGIAMSLNPNDQRNLHDLFRAVILNDGNRAGRLMVERAHYERCSMIPGGIDAFALGIEDLVSEFHTRRKDGLTLGAVRIGSLLSRVLDLCRIYGVEIDPNMSSIVISTLVLEGLGRSLEPELNLIDFAVPFVVGRGRV